MVGWLLRRLGRERLAQALAHEGWALISIEDLFDLLLCTIRYASTADTGARRYVIPQIVMRNAGYLPEMRREILYGLASQVAEGMELGQRAWWVVALEALKGGHE